MTVHPEIRVFISSTMRDLRPERYAIKEAIERRLRWIREAVTVEHGPIPDEASLKHCLRRVEECQAYVVLVASRYGTRVEREGRGIRSFTEHEYDRASEVYLHRIRLLSKTVKWRQCDDRTALLAFRDRLRGDSICGDFPKYKAPPDQCYRVIADKAIQALQDQWERLNGRLFLVVNGSHHDYVSSADLVAEIRRWVAQDSGEDKVSNVWLFPAHHFGASCTFFWCLLPAVAEKRYLRRGAGNWHGGVLLAWPMDDDSMPRLLQLALALLRELARYDQLKRSVRQALVETLGFAMFLGVVRTLVHLASYFRGIAGGQIVNWLQRLRKMPRNPRSRRRIVK